MDDAATDREMPMFPLGSVLFPDVPLPLRIFESRYLQMLQDVLQHDPVEFGVVLIERGHEVGGGDHRFPVGTVARVTALEPDEGFVSVMGVGTRRIEVQEWLADEPYPRARVRDLAPLKWDESLEPAREAAEALVRRTLARAWGHLPRAQRVGDEYEDQRWPAVVELSEDPLAALWQLAAITPVGPLDQQALLRTRSAASLVATIVTATQEADELLAARGD